MGMQETIEKTKEFVKNKLKDAESGHDWWHVYRVWQLSKTIAKSEKADMLVIELGSLLHDIADPKFNNGDEEVGALIAQNFLESIEIDEKTIEHITQIIRNISFRGGNHEQKFHSKELDIVQDADRLDAIGAIGIARTFSYGGFRKRKIYDPEEKPKMNMTKEEYQKNDGCTINHFYEKLLLLKDRMNTKTGKKIAEHRHKFMLTFLDEFYKEWDGEK